MAHVGTVVIIDECRYIPDQVSAILIEHKLTQLRVVTNDLFPDFPKQPKQKAQWKQEVHTWKGKKR